MERSAPTQGNADIAGLVSIVAGVLGRNFTVADVDSLAESSD